ncbi:MAG: hypothetical protein B7Z66_07495 [Chromatiales bacterium 21-64-14]|nr:MAG: hypothetical protein B7Z66_07495 [Chromatiales bacterium 21-64-14]
MPAPELQIRVDTRERGKLIKRLEQLEGVILTFVELEVGDYILPGGIVVEHKSATDLILSVVDESLWENVKKLGDTYDKVVYIVEGDPYTARFHQKALDIHRAMAHMTIAKDVSILPSPDADNSAMLIYLMGLAALERATREPPAS